ncbi:MAG: hypothetical protein H8Z69_03180 [Nanohaloarchaea archaeon]|nr:hypothetical protein [Candidatus Nanohaloarchaea archaeon]
MKKQLLLALTTIGLIASSSAFINFDSNFSDFDSSNQVDSEDDDFWDDGEFWNDDFFDDSEEEEPENESEAGVCVIGVDSPCNSEEYDGDNETEDTDQSEEEIEERHVTPAPEPEAVGENWISYPNPRDHVLNYDTINDHGDIKVCTVLLNQRDQVITGESVNVELSVDTNISEGVSEYDDSNPVRFDTPLNQVADLIGTSDEYREGDGMLDAECAEYHNLPFGTYTYSNLTVSGEDSEQVEFVGVTEYWDDRPDGGDPFNRQVSSYGENELSDGTVTVTPDEDNNHAEVIFVAKINR